MSQKTIFCSPMKQKALPLEARSQSLRLIWQIVDKRCHWKTQILSEFNNQIFKKLNICILSISQKQIIFTVWHPAFLEKVRPIEAIALTQINEILRKPCPCKQACFDRPKSIEKLTFFVKYEKKLQGKRSDKV